MPDPDLRRARMVFLLVPLAMLGLLIIAFAAFQLRTRAQIRHYETLARGRKEPLTLKALTATYAAIPDQDNAAVPLLALWETENPEYWKAFKAGRRKLPERPTEKPIPFPKDNDRSNTNSAESNLDHLGPLLMLVAARSEYREAVREALRRPGCRFPLRITDGITALLPHLARLKRDAEEFRAEAWVATERGDVATSVRAIQDCAKAGTLFLGDPFLIGQLVRIACNSMCLTEIERLLSRLSPSDSQLGELGAMLQGLSALDGYHRAMICERAIGLSVFEPPMTVLLDDAASTQDGGEETAGLSRIMVAMRLTGLQQLDRCLFMETFEHLLTNAPLDSSAKLLAVETAMTKTETRIKKFPPKIFSGMLLPSLQNGARKFCRSEALREAALTAVAIERHRLAHRGKLPETLSELVPAGLPEIPRDPFDGQPLRFRRLEQGYVVYSVGSDRTDDGGKEKPKKSVSGPFDVTFTVRR